MAESPKKTYEQLKQECWERGLYIGGKPPEQWGEKQITAFKEKFAITQDQWDSIPNAEIKKLK